MVFFFEAANITNPDIEFGLRRPSTSRWWAGTRLPTTRLRKGCNADCAHSGGGRATFTRCWTIRNRHQRGPEQGRVGGADAGGCEQQPADLADSSSRLLPLNGWTGTPGSYNVAIQTPQYRIDSLAALMRTPVTSPIGGMLSTTAASLAGTSNAGVSAVGAGPSQATAAYGNPGTMTNGVQLLENLAGVTRGWRRRL